MTSTTAQKLRPRGDPSQGLRRASTDGACCGVARVAPAMHLEEGMDSHALTNRQHDGITRQPFFRWCLAVFVAIALFFLWQEHRAHLLGALPWLLLLACPLMHVLMHRRHRGQHGDHATQPGESNEKKDRGGHGCC